MQWPVCRLSCTSLLTKLVLMTVSPLATVARASGMKFKAIATPDRATFDQWVAKAKQSPNSMDSMAAFEKVAVPSEYNKVEYFSNVKPDLFKML